mmetsp:Transcript_42694/g.110102  ORF Transcript_42694/g.110102 Transcript_42694/m.110102 type:complete len:84 (-) Transcript_42694:29-280(-)
MKACMGQNRKHLTRTPRRHCAIENSLFLCINDHVVKKPLIRKKPSTTGGGRRVCEVQQGAVLPSCCKMRLVGSHSGDVEHHVV